MVVVEEEVSDSLQVVWVVSLADGMSPDDAMVHLCTLGSLEGIWTYLAVVSLESRESLLLLGLLLYEEDPEALA